MLNRREKKNEQFQCVKMFKTTFKAERKFCLNKISLEILPDIHACRILRIC